MYRLGWFSTGRDEAARWLLKTVHDRIREGFLPAEITYVFLSRRPGESRESDIFLDLCRELNLPVIHLSAREFEPELRRRDRELWRTLYHRAVLEKLPEEVDLVVLAGYMWVVSEEMCERLPMINLHPALPGGPKGTWQEVIWQLISARAAETGVMMHRVTPVLDEGPAITFCRFSVRDESFRPLWEACEEKLLSKGLSALISEEGEAEPLFRRIREEGVRRELPLIVYTLKALAEGEVDPRNPGRPLDLSGRIERHLRTGEWR
ncbi:phosphoribosylglycinamide formyltransferase [Thermosulfurimonas sp. F29]|uniref:phosphoribosylglycinamide formyltransferase n=1 Tax=Thermosulfurimonas sp. F29 TaxID=2867247 RepID=UPI001C838EF2|nr:formyltransferase family protein [Thermosulfurimonas sp. F29]MBX6423877.1 formyl transferase [Thermosulfurimonas sp. F29]